MEISVITVCKDAEKTIQDCLRSVSNQTVSAEHLIIDGDSKDDTKNIVRNFESNAELKIISEPDEGLYDAMNKGVMAARGDIIGILNSDDVFADNQVLARVRRALENTDEAGCYGNLIYVDRLDTGMTRRTWRAGNFARQKFFWGWMVPHPTMYLRREVYERYGLYRKDLSTAADYELMIRLFVKHRVRLQYVDELIVKMRVGGRSNVDVKARLRANSMDRKAWSLNGVKPYPWTITLKPIRKINQFFS